MGNLTDCEVSFSMVVKVDDYVKWCKDFDLIPDEGGFRDYAQQSFLNHVRANWHKLKIEDC